jgi:hypothetical protein
LAADFRVVLAAFLRVVDFFTVAFFVADLPAVFFLVLRREPAFAADLLLLAAGFLAVFFLAADFCEVFFFEPADDVRRADFLLEPPVAFFLDEVLAREPAAVRAVDFLVVFLVVVFLATTGPLIGRPWAP